MVMTKSSGKNMTPTPLQIVPFTLALLADIIIRSWTIQ
jgi:hypothetical protein